MEQGAILDMFNIFTDDFRLANGSIINAYDASYAGKDAINLRCDDTVILHIACGIEWKNRHKEFVQKLFSESINV